MIFLGQRVDVLQKTFVVRLTFDVLSDGRFECIYEAKHVAERIGGRFLAERLEFGGDFLVAQTDLLLEIWQPGRKLRITTCQS